MSINRSEWYAFLEEGRCYRKTAQGSVRRPEIFTPTIVQNVAAMGIEKYFMAIFAKRGMLPRHHTMTDLAEEAGAFVELGDETVKTLRYMDSLQRICSLDDWRIESPKTDDIPRFIAALEHIANIAEREFA